MNHLLLLALVWLFYFLVHSLCAGLGLKRWVATHRPRLLPAYRLLFNLQAVILLLPPLWLTWSYDGPWMWRWEGVWAWLANGVALAGVAGFFWSLRWYDMDEFLGLLQWRRGQLQVEDLEQLHLSPMHRYVRHPWYLFGLMILWSRDMNAAWLLSTLLATGYFWGGSWLEEHKLMVYHGEAYRRYRERVPRLLPWPGRSLTAAEAQVLEALAREDPPPE